MNKKKGLQTIKLLVITLILCVFGLILLIAWDDERQLKGQNTQNINYGEYTKYVDIYDVVKEAYITNNGYTGEISKHMAEDVFKHTNYKSYNVDSIEYAKPLKVDCELKEVYQTKDKDNNLIYVDTIYSLLITDANGKIVGGAKYPRVTYTVRIDESGWYIISMYEKIWAH